MLINFCHPCLNPLLSCDTISSDGYEITNLIAVDSSQQKGFLADYFMKPPMTITVELICDVNLSHIVIYPRVGAQKSTGFEIYASQESNNFNCNKQQLIGAGSIRGSEDCIVFSKRRKIDGSLNSANIPFAQYLFFSRDHNIVSRAKTISIKIIRTLRSSVPSLKKIEIWGHPSSNCSPNSKRRVEILWRDSTQDVLDEEPFDSNQSSEEREEAVDAVDPELTVPEEFVDVITYNVMALPMLLPSGKVVDQSTLEKCAQVDALSGRVPSDPFTGEMFTEHRKPVFFSSLKVRLDKFLNDNAHHEALRSTARTVGKRKFNDHSTSTKKICDKFVQNKNKRNSTSSYLCDHQGTSAAPDSNCSSRSMVASKDKNIQVTETCDSSFKHSNSSDNSGHMLKKTVDEDKAKSSTVEVICIDEPDMEEVIDLSDDSNNSRSSDSNQNSSHQPTVNRLYTSTSHNVDDILQKTLAGLPSFTRPVNTAKPKQKQCYCCSVAANLYSLPCSHFFCRPCLLLNTKELRVCCQNCNSEFSSSEPVRFHQ